MISDMGLIKGACRAISDELDTILVLDKRVHHTLVYGITHVRNSGRKVVKKTSEKLSQYGQE
jgi:hypothetical protein